MKALLVILLCLPALAKKPEPVWVDGFLINQVSATCDANEACMSYVSYQIATGDMVYTVRRNLRFLHDKDIDVTVNAPIKFAIEGRKGYVQDEHGKAHEVYLVQKAKK